MKGPGGAMMDEDVGGTRKGGVTLETSEIRRTDGHRLPQRGDHELSPSVPDGGDGDDTESPWGSGASYQGISRPSQLAAEYPKPEMPPSILISGWRDHVQK